MSSIQEASSLKASHPSIIRHVVLFAICLLYLISYIDRGAISITAPQITKQFHFTATQMGLIFSAFSVTYSLLPVFVGALGDRRGARTILPVLMGWWSLFTILTGLASSFVSFIIVRLLFGLGESGSLPVSTSALANWYPPSQRGFLQGITHAAARIGAAVAVPIVVVMVLAFHNWRPSYYILGVVGLVWAILFYFLFRDKPSQVNGVNADELAIIDRGRSATAASNAARPAVPWKRILSSKDIWVLAITQFIYGYTFWIYFTWLPTYLTTERHFSFAQLGIVASLPLFGGVLGDITGGWASDQLYKATGNLNLARRTTIVISFIGAAAFTVPAILVKSPLVAELLTIGTLFMLECAVSNIWAVAMDLGGEYYSGTISGFVSMAFGIAGIIAPSVFGIQKDMTGTSLVGFMTGSVLLVLGAFLIFLVNANKTVLPDELALAAMHDESKLDDHKLHLSKIVLNDEQFPEAISELKAPPAAEEVTVVSEPEVLPASDEATIISQAESPNTNGTSIAEEKVESSTNS
jgi:sugar phosphate permease